MNVLLWILQIALALFCVAGGQYKVFHYDELAKMPQTGAMSRGVWGAIGVFEILCDPARRPPPPQIGYRS
jgi:hypothetical protein